MSIFFNSKSEYAKARVGKYAIGAFDTTNLEITQAICEAAQESRAPVIIQTTASAIEYAGLEQIFDIVKNEVVDKEISAAIHLDHGKDFGLVKKCMEIGYQSVMIDGSYLDFEENVHLTRKVVESASSHHVCVEAEIGRISKEEGGKLSHKGAKTDPNEAKEFVERTGIDILAVSVGNEHGAPKGEKLDLELIETLAKTVEIPLVIHGSSGLSQNDIREAIKLGVVKFNIDTNIRHAFSESVEESDSGDPREVLAAGRDAVKKLVVDYIRLFGSAGK
jgi:fructose-bisphosphate aldolase class II